MSGNGVRRSVSFGGGGKAVTAILLTTLIGVALPAPATGQESTGGDNDTSQTGPRFTAVSAGYEHSCGLRADGSVVCWGHNDLGQAEAPAGRFSAVSAGWFHSCGLRADGSVVCWGASDAWIDLDALAGRFTAVSAGWFHACGLRADGTVVCWDVIDDAPAAGQMDAPAGRFSAVSAGVTHSCGLRTDGSVVCWGAWVDLDAPAGRFTAVSAGYAHSCGLRADGSVICWGDNSEGQADVPAGRFSAVSAGEMHSCGLRTDGSIICWTSILDEYTGQLEEPAGRFSTESPGCGLRADGSIVCWGHEWPAEYSGQADAPAGRFSAVSAGGGHSCGLRTDGSVVCWGANDHGQADAPTVSSLSPSQDERRVIISLGDNNSGSNYCPNGQLPCRWVNVTTENFSAGTYWTRCVWQNSLSGQEYVPISGNMSADDHRSATFNRYCSFNTQPGRYLHVTVDGVRSNVIRMSGEPSQAPEPTPSSGPPGPPRNLRLSLSDDNSIMIAWDPPLGDGGAPVEEYEVQVLRRQLFPLPRSWTYETNSSPLRFDGESRSNATYSIQVMSRNGAGSGGPVIGQIVTHNRPSEPASLTIRRIDNDSFRINWTPPVDDGGLPILGYTVTLKRTFSFSSLSEHSHGNDITSMAFDDLRYNTRYTVKVAARNSLGTGPAIVERHRTGQPQRRCPSGNKYKMESRPWYDWRGIFTTVKITALTSFTAADDQSISSGLEGGEIQKIANLTQSGCSWIFPGATVEDDARVSDNAYIRGSAHVHDNAKVYGNAAVVGANVNEKDNVNVKDSVQVYGNARIEGRIEGGVKLKGKARVYGNAVVSGGVVEDDARVYENAGIGGSAHVHDKARVYGNAAVVEQADIEDEARVYGNARIEGHANIKDDAHVYGNARIKGRAKIKDSARVRGNAVISGSAVISGTAIIDGDVKVNSGEISSGTFDGKEEYISALEDMHDQVFSGLYQKLSDCRLLKAKPEYSDYLIRKHVRRMIGLTKISGTDRVEDEYRKEIGTQLWVCGYAKTVAKMLKAVWPDWTAFLPSPLGGFILLNRMRKIADEVDAFNEWDAMIDYVRESYESVKKLCERDTSCQQRLTKLTER